MNPNRLAPNRLQSGVRISNLAVWVACLALLGIGACTKVTREDPPAPPPGYAPPGGTPIPAPEAKEKWIDKSLDAPNPLNQPAAGATPAASPTNSWFQNRMKEAGGKLDAPKKKP